MGMNFTITVSADFEQSLDADDLISRYDVDTDMLGLPSSVSLEDVQLGGTVDISGRLTVEDVEVSASAMGDFDAEDALSNEGIDLRLSNVDFDIIDSPSGFDVVESVLGDRDSALSVYAALADAGFEVS